MIIHNKFHNKLKCKISKYAKLVLKKLNKYGYQAFIVGGSVRDVILNKIPKDFDVTTNATPEQICKLFKYSRIIGKRFKIVHLFFKKKIIEVSTFRGDHIKKNKKIRNKSQKTIHGMLLRDNIFGNIREDAFRRDITINSLYYNPNDFGIRDYVGGIKDLKNKKIKLIGNPIIRYKEDPIRMLRVIRFSIYLNMSISYKTSQAIAPLSKLIINVSPSRLFDELIKLFNKGNIYYTYKILRRYLLFHAIFPHISKYFTKNESSNIELMIKLILKNYYKINKKNNISLVIASMFWYPQLNFFFKNIFSIKKKYNNECELKINDSIRKISINLLIPKKIILIIRQIWKLQFFLLQKKSKTNFKVIKHPRFYLGYMLLKMRANVEKTKELKYYVNFWTNKKFNF
ncbi:polynucleotide adenylyltransferase PcnB [Buchnera aphidicola (Taiwanaphis decaspermi)]|uniref:polynucleotide adenylyltransferase PcnB n=1 Tax=Buchnera aphidicola TaxID=9 RepID=UPI0031B83AD0